LPLNGDITQQETTDGEEPPIPQTCEECFQLLVSDDYIAFISALQDGDLFIQAQAGGGVTYQPLSVGQICNLLAEGEIDLSGLADGLLNAIGQNVSSEERQIVIECLERLFGL
jgi:hypothetical protein